MPNRFKEARTELNKNGHESVKEVSKATGITGSLIDDLETDTATWEKWHKAPRDVGYSKIKTLAEHYGVSSDYLLGLSDQPTIDAKAAGAAEYTGLSLEAIRRLHNLHVANFSGLVSKGYEVSYIGLLSKIIELDSGSDYNYSILGEISHFMVYGEALPEEAYGTTEDGELSLEEWDRFHRWANGHHREIVSRKEARELHLQLAGENLKMICRAILEKALAEKKEQKDDGKH